MEFEYDPVDLALLTELRRSWEQDEKVPVSLLRVLDARGWIEMPFVVDVDTIDLIGDAEGDVGFSLRVGPIRLTQAGSRELTLFFNRVGYAEWSAILEEDENELDGGDVADEDGA